MMLRFCLFVCLLLSTVATFATEFLPKEELAALVKGGQWTNQTGNTSTRKTWIWEDDNTLCLKLGETDSSSKCADTGTWVIKDNVLCYELSWIFKSSGHDKVCLTVATTDDQTYSAYYHGEALVTEYFSFTVGK